MPGTMAGLSQAELEARKAQLQAILYAPAKIVLVDGVRVEYKSDAEILAAIASLDEAIAILAGTTAPRFVRTALGAGYTG